MQRNQPSAPQLRSQRCLVFLHEPVTTVTLPTVIKVVIITNNCGRRTMSTLHSSSLILCFYFLNSHVDDRGVELSRSFFSLWTFQALGSLHIKGGSCESPLVRAKWSHDTVFSSLTTDRLISAAPCLLVGGSDCKKFTMTQFHREILLSRSACTDISAGLDLYHLYLVKLIMWTHKRQK